MTTPSRNKIIAEAERKFMMQQVRSMDCDIVPENSELLESGFIDMAKLELMGNSKRAIDKIYNQYYERDTENFDEFSINVNEALASGVYVSGTTGSGKSDIAMYAVDAIREAVPEMVFVAFDPSQDWMQRSSIQRVETLTSAYIRDVPTQSTIYDLSLLTVRDCQKLIENFNEKLMLQQALTRSQTPYFLVFEESHTYFPEGCMRAKRYQNTVRMMTQGRNFKVRFMCITQFAALMDKNAMRYMKQRYFGFTDEPNDVDYIARIIGKSEAEKLQSLNAGEFAYWHSGKLDKIAVEPYESDVSKEYIATITPQPQPKPLPKVATTDYNPLLKAVVVGAIGLAILLLGMV
jgi:hypothetical protein